MSLLLTHGYFLQEDPKEQEIMRPYPPLGLLYISSYLEKHQVDHHVIDPTFYSNDQWLEEVKAYKPKIIAFYVNLMTKVKVIQLIEVIRKMDSMKNTKIVLGGSDITFNWENYLKHGADFLVIGEGEETFLELYHQLNSEKNYSSIQGLAYKKQNGELVKNQERTKIKEIDFLPEPNRKKIDLYKYLEVWKDFHGQNALNISTQRGCPYTCEWCSTAVYGQSYRRRDPIKVVDEIEGLIEDYNPDALWFVDDVFTVSHKWVAAFSQEMKRRKIKIPFECTTRAERMNEKVIALLKEAGCFRVWIGAESGSQRIIDLMNRQVKINKVAEVIQLIKSFGIEAGTFIMVGYPTETKRDIDLTIDYLKSANPDHFTITIVYPIKGTGLYDLVEEDITVKNDWASSTDRQIDFKRTYSRKYYDFAIRRIVNEIKYYKEKVNGEMISTSALKFKTKSIVSSVLMKVLQS